MKTDAASSQFDPTAEKRYYEKLPSIGIGQPTPPQTEAPGTARRRAILREIEGAVCRDRQNTYGDAEDNFATIAQLWTVYAQAAGIIGESKSFGPEQVAVMSTLIKVARAAVSPGHADNWIDAAGYMVCGGGIMQAWTEGGV